MQEAPRSLHWTPSGHSKSNNTVFPVEVLFVVVVVFVGATVDNISTD